MHTGRRPAAAGDSRAEILVAARALFAARGFRGATTRQIAAQAGVDVALIHHFFGTKAALFDAAIQFPRIGGESAAALQSPGDVGERIARLYLEHLFVEEIETFSAVLRTVVGDPNDIPALHEKIYTLLQQVSAQLAAHEAARGASTLGLELIAAQMVGILVMRYLIRLEPIASASIDEVVRRLAPSFRALLRAPEQEESA